MTVWLPQPKQNPQDKAMSEIEEVQEGSPQENQRVSFNCPCCGSNNVSKEVSCSWDVSSQTWGMNDSVSPYICNDCGAETGKPIVLGLPEQNWL